MIAMTVFCGSSHGNDKDFLHRAEMLGTQLAKREIGLVYGGAKVGLMGALADAVLREGGTVTGVLPDFLRSKEIAHEELTELILVESMHERKMKMHELSDGIIALPGGFGTMEELFEMLTWAQLGLHRKPVGILNVKGFYDPLLTMIQSMVDSGFLKEINQKMLLVSDDIDDLLQQMLTYDAPIVAKWIDTKAT